MCLSRRELLQCNYGAKRERTGVSVFDHGGACRRGCSGGITAASGAAVGGADRGWGGENGAGERPPSRGAARRCYDTGRLHYCRIADARRRQDSFGAGAGDRGVDAGCGRLRRGSVLMTVDFNRRSLLRGLLMGTVTRMASAETKIPAAL